MPQALEDLFGLSVKHNPLFCFLHKNKKEDFFTKKGLCLLSAQSLFLILEVFSFLIPIIYYRRNYFDQL